MAICKATVFLEHMDMILPGICCTIIEEMSKNLIITL